MNLGIYRSWHAAVAAVCVAAFLTWHLAAPLPFGDRADANVGFLLTTGWFAVAAYVALALYAARRAAHRLRLTPEFAWRAELPQLERAQSQLTELQNRIARRELGGRATIRRSARDILARHGIRTLRVHVENDPVTLGMLRLRVEPREALGRLSSWLSAHIWYGIAAALLVWFHGGGRIGSTMGLWLNALSYFVIGSGLLGGLLWTFGPTWLTRAERELSVEKAFALRSHFAAKLAEAQRAAASAPDRLREATAVAEAAERDVAAAKAAATDPAGDEAAKKQAKKAVKAAETESRKAAAAVVAIEKEAEGLPTEIATLTGQSRAVAREAARLGRYRTLLRGWRLLHVPCSVLLLALVAVHVISIYYY